MTEAVGFAELWLCYLFIFLLSVSLAFFVMFPEVVFFTNGKLSCLITLFCFDASLAKKNDVEQITKRQNEKTRS